MIDALQRRQPVAYPIQCLSIFERNQLDARACREGRSRLSLPKASWSAAGLRPSAVYLVGRPATWSTVSD